MKQSRFIIGIGLCIVGALILVFTARPQSLPAAITIGIVGIALIATSRR